MTTDLIQQIEDVVGSALRKIGATDVPQKVVLAVKFAGNQPPVEITLDGKRAFGVAVDIASVFSPEENYHQYADDNGTTKTVESVQALSVVIVGNSVRLCKSKYDVISDSLYGKEKYINVMYWTTTVDMLTEKYIC